MHPTPILVFALIVAAYAAGQIDDAKKDIESGTMTRTGNAYCPPGAGVITGTLSKLAGTKLGGEQCSQESVFHYYSCCGDMLTTCCFRLQTWVIVVLAVIAAILLTSIVLSLLRCIFCRR